jgi:nucleoid-associated protein Lsr2
MASVTEVRLVDDIDGGEAAETVAFDLADKNYEIDLSETHAAKLRDVLAPYVAAARWARSSPTARGRRTTAARPSADRQETAAIREWAAANGFEVGTRGRIAANVREAYENRNNSSAAALSVRHRRLRLR